MSLLSLLLELLLTLFVVRQLLVWLERRLLVFFHWLRKTKLILTLVTIWNSLPGLPRRIFSYLAQVWHNLSHFSRNLIINLIIGLSLTWVLLTFFHDLPWLREQEDEGMDLVMQLTQGIIPPLQEKNMPPLVFLDINDETHRKWGEPMFTPRNHVKDMIIAAVEAPARLVIVDIDLSRKTPIDGLGLSSELHPYDQELYDYLKNYSISCQKKENKVSCPTIILFRSFSDKDKLTGTIPPIPILKPRESFLDGAVKSSTYVQWASSLFFSSAKDHIVRRWWLWQPICTQQQEPSVIPSIELLAAALIKNHIPQPKLIQSLNASLDKPKNCSSPYYQPSQTEEPIKIGELLINPDTLIDIRQRITYKIPWFTNEKDYCGKHLKSYVLTPVQAHDYAGCLKGFDKSSIFEDRIVVIGSSHQESGDIHLTPLGKMPGAMIIINAIYSLLQYGTIEPIAIWQQLLIQMGLIISICFLSANFVHLLVKRLQFSSNVLCFFSLISSAFILALMLPISIIFFLYYGIWIDFVIPLILIQLNQTVATFIDLRR